MLLGESHNFIYELCRYSNSDGAYVHSTFALEFCLSVTCASSMVLDTRIEFFVMVLKLNA